MNNKKRTRIVKDGLNCRLVKPLPLVAPCVHTGIICLPSCKCWLTDFYHQPRSQRISYSTYQLPTRIKAQYELNPA